MKSDGVLKLDINYYVKQQIHPVVGRLCEPIEGTDNAQLAEHLGLDTAQYHREKPVDADEEFAGGLTVTQTDEEKFKDVEKLVVTCPSCRADFEISGMVRGDVNDLTSELECGLNCTNCQARIPIKLLCNLMTLKMRAYINKYYQSWSICEDASCGARCRTTQCIVCGARVFPEYSANQLHNQMMWFKTMTDSERLKEKLADKNAQVRGPQPIGIIFSIQLLPALIQKKL